MASNNRSWLSAIKDFFWSLVSSPDPPANCPICHDVMTNPSQTPCEHVFCSDCLEPWLKKSRTCPMCRRRLPKKEKAKKPKIEREVPVEDSDYEDDGEADIDPDGESLED